MTCTTHRSASNVTLPISSFKLGLSAQSQLPPKAPEVKAEKKTKGSEKDQSNAEKSRQESIPISPANPDTRDSNHNTQYGDEEGSEYLPAFHGIRVKITDFLLALELATCRPSYSLDRALP